MRNFLKWLVVVRLCVFCLLSATYAKGSLAPADVDIGTGYGKTNLNKTGALTTTAVTANQVLLTYTVTAGKTFFISALEIEARLTVLSATASILGACSWRIGGVAQNTFNFTNQTISAVDRAMLIPAAPIFVAGGTVIDMVCTPAATTSMLWQGNLMGYEK
jgi:hypothetical protein